MRKSLCLAVILLMGFTFMLKADEPIGVFVNNNTNCIQLINPITQQTSPSLLKGELGSYGGGLFDIAITSNGRRAVLSNFGDSKVFIVAIGRGFTGTPYIVAEVSIPFFAEDIVITPDDKWALVTDGGFSPRVAAVNLTDFSVVDNLLGSNSAQAVDISADGKIVLVADYFGSMIHSYTFHTSSGTLSYNNTVNLGYGVRPVNVAISPDGQNALVASSNTDITPVLTFWGNGKIHINNYITLPKKGCQTVVFNSTGTKAYYSSTTVYGGTKVFSVNITGPGAVSVGSTISLSIPRGTSQLFGVDTMAIDPSGNYLYVSNPTVSGGVVEISVVDLTTNTEVNQIAGHGIPTGIAFGTINKN